MHVLCCVGHQQSSPPQAPLFPPGSPEDLLQSCTHFLRGELTTLIEEQAQLATGAFHAGSATALRFRYGSHLVLVPELRKAPPSRRVSFLHPSASRRPPPLFITRLKCALPLCTPPPTPCIFRLLCPRGIACSTSLHLHGLHPQPLPGRGGWLGHTTRGSPGRCGLLPGCCRGVLPAGPGTGGLHAPGSRALALWQRGRQW